jgi:hypothetical protein
MTAFRNEWEFYLEKWKNSYLLVALEISKHNQTCNSAIKCNTRYTILNEWRLRLDSKLQFIGFGYNVIKNLHKNTMCIKDIYLIIFQIVSAFEVELVKLLFQVYFHVEFTQSKGFGNQFLSVSLVGSVDTKLKKIEPSQLWEEKLTAKYNTQWYFKTCIKDRAVNIMMHNGPTSAKLWYQNFILSKIIWFALIVNCGFSNRKRLSHMVKFSVTIER